MTIKRLQFVKILYLGNITKIYNPEKFVVTFLMNILSLIIESC